MSSEIGYNHLNGWLDGNLVFKSSQISYSVIGLGAFYIISFNDDSKDNG